MSTTTPITPYQGDVIKTASAILYVIDDMSTHDALRQQTPLNDHQVRFLEDLFSSGLTRWDHEVKAHRTPAPTDISRIAIIADKMSQRYPNGIKKDQRGQVTIIVSDIVDAWNLLAEDITHFAAQRDQWENPIYTLFLADSSNNSTVQPDPRLQSAESVGHLIAKSLGIDGIFNPIFDSGVTPQTEVPPLPNYPPNDTRNDHLQLMQKLQLDLSVTEGLLATITPDQPHENRTNQLLEWVTKRANKALKTVTGLLVPSGVARLSSQLDDSARILKQSRDMLNLCIYGEEHALAEKAAQFAVERSFWTTLFLAVCPNIPFIIPTIELRLAITKPLYYVTRGAHEALGDIPIFGLLFWMMRGMGWLIDSIPRAQVRLVQGLTTDGWLANTNKRHQIIRRYLHHADKQTTQPRVNALKQVLLSIVS